MLFSIVHLSFSSSGGAGSVAAILSEAQRAAGHNSHHLSAISSTLWLRPLDAPIHALAAGADQFLIKRASFGAPISLLRDSLNWDFDTLIHRADILHLHNVNGIGAIGELARRFPTTKIVWTLHDMNPFTGTCHYSLGCTQFTRDCSMCPAVKPGFQRLVATSFRKKQAELQGIHDLRVVAPSQWLASAASESQLLSRFPISTISNPLDPMFLGKRNDSPRRQHSFAVVAQNLDDPVKKVEEATSAFLRLKDKHPSATMVLMGRGGTSLRGEGIENLGPLSKENLVRALSQTEAIVVPSHAENAPMVIAEAAAVGCVPIVRATGGMPAMVAQLGNGQTFTEGDELELAMSAVLSRTEAEKRKTSTALTSQAIKLYSPNEVQKEYDVVYAQ